MREDITSLFFCVSLDLSSNLGKYKILKGITTVAGSNTFTCGFKPKIIIVCLQTQVIYVNTEEDTNNQYLYPLITSDPKPTTYKLNYGTNKNGLLEEITEDGFKFGISSSKSIFIVARG